MQRIQAVIFDMDGVLVDSEPFYMAQELISYARYGIALEKSALSRFVGTTQGSMWSTIKDEFGLIEPLDFLMAQHHQQLIQAIGLDPLESMPGAQTFLAALNAAGTACAVGSSSAGELVEVILRDSQLRPHFQHVVCGTDVKKGKPAPDIFLLTAERLGVTPDVCLVIEDSHHGVAAAKAAGMFCIGLSNPNSGQQDLSAADMCVQNHDEIRQWFIEHKHL